MKVVLTGASGGVGQEILRQRPDAKTISFRSRHASEPYDALAELLKDADVLIHAGAKLPPAHGPDLVEANVLLPWRILDCVEHARGKGFPVVLLGSMSVLDSRGKYQPVSRMSDYAYSKWLLEEDLRDKFPDFSGTKMVRFSTLFYRDPQKDGLSKLVHTAKTMGGVDVVSCMRDFLPLDKACQSLLEVAGKICAGGAGTLPRIVNLAAGRATNMLEIARHLETKYGTRINYRGVLGTEVCSQFSPVETYGLAPIDVDIFREVELYYERIDFCDRSQG